MQTLSGHVLGLDFAERTGTLCVEFSRGPALPEGKEEEAPHRSGFEIVHVKGGLVLHLLKFRGTKCKSFK